MTTESSEQQPPTARVDDSPQDQLWKQRRIALHPDPPVAIVNGMLGKVRVIAAIVKDLGMPTIVLLVFVGWFSGYIPFPLFSYLSSLNATEAIVAQRLEKMRDELASHQATQRELFRITALSFRVMCENSATDFGGKVNQKQFNNCQQIHE